MGLLVHLFPTLENRKIIVHTKSWTMEFYGFVIVITRLIGMMNMLVSILSIY